MWDDIKTYVSKYHIIEKNDRIMVGLSGGADSVCLLRFLVEISEEFSLFLAAVHINHKIRKEGADRDEAFVKTLCEKYKIPFCLYQIDVEQYASLHKCSVEEGGREVRYQCFQEAAKEHRCNKIALAHHEDDLAETVLFRMIRGTGIEGLAAMTPVNGRYIRPLLGIKKQEIVEILNGLGQEYMEDETNGELEYSRNYIRNVIMPNLIRVNDRAAEHMARLAGEAAELAQYLAPILDEAYASCVEKKKEESILDLEAYEQYPGYLQKKIMRRMLQKEAGHKRDLGAIHIGLLTDLAKAPGGKRISLPYNLMAVKEQGRIRIGKKKNYEITEQACADTEAEITQEILSRGFLPHPGGKGRIEFQFLSPEEADCQNNDCIKCFDYDKIKNSMCIRHRKDGDYFIMDKNGHRKSLRRYFIDEKIPSAQRKERWLLADGSHIMWIIGGRMSEAYKVTRDTKSILRVSIDHIH